MKDRIDWWPLLLQRALLYRPSRHRDLKLITGVRLGSQVSD